MLRRGLTEDQTPPNNSAVSRPGPQNQRGIAGSRDDTCRYSEKRASTIYNQCLISSVLFLVERRLVSFTTDACVIWTDIFSHVSLSEPSLPLLLSHPRPSLLFLFLSVTLVNVSELLVYGSLRGRATRGSRLTSWAGAGIDELRLVFHTQHGTDGRFQEQLGRQLLHEQQLRRHFSDSGAGGGRTDAVGPLAVRGGLDGDGRGEAEVRGEEQQGSELGIHVGDWETERDGGRRGRCTGLHVAHVPSRGRLYCPGLQNLRRDLARPFLRRLRRSWWLSGTLHFFFELELFLEKILHIFFQLWNINGTNIAREWHFPLSNCKINSETA